MKRADRHVLHFSPYRPPPLRRGDRAFCLFRDRQVLITGWSDARIPWPRCRAIGIRGGSGLLVDEVLARAVRNESAAAVRYWWGASITAVYHWRQALGVTRTSNAGSNRLVRAAAAKGAAAMKAREWTEAEREQRRRTNVRLNLVRFAVPGSGRQLWTAADVALLGKLPDDEVARRVGRAVEGVRVKRSKLGIPAARDGRKRGNRA